MPCVYLVIFVDKCDFRKRIHHFAVVPAGQINSPYTLLKQRISRKHYVVDKIAHAAGRMTGSFHNAERETAYGKAVNAVNVIGYLAIVAKYSPKVFGRACRQSRVLFAAVNGHAVFFDYGLSTSAMFEMSVRQQNRDGLQALFLYEFRYLISVESGIHNHAAFCLAVVKHISIGGKYPRRNFLHFVHKSSPFT